MKTVDELIKGLQDMKQWHVERHDEIISVLNNWPDEVPLDCADVAGGGCACLTETTYTEFCSTIQPKIIERFGECKLMSFDITWWGGGVFAFYSIGESCIRAEFSDRYQTILPKLQKIEELSKVRWDIDDEPEFVKTWIEAKYERVSK